MLDLPAWIAPAATTFGLILLAELGDKSQLVCMTLAARHHHGPVLIGSMAAFVVLNTLAAVFGVGLSQWIPERVLSMSVALLFGAFGIMSLRASQEDAGEVTQERRLGSLALTTFLMILLAEMGDKTQLAVAGLASSLPPLAVWIGATLALSVTSALGVIVGRRLLRSIPLHRLHQASGVVFLLLAGFALSRAL